VYIKALFDLLGGWADANKNNVLEQNELAGIIAINIQQKATELIAMLQYIPALHTALNLAAADQATQNAFRVIFMNNNDGALDLTNPVYIKALFDLLGGWADANKNNVLEQNELAGIAAINIQQKAAELIAMLPYIVPLHTALGGNNADFAAVFGIAVGNQNLNNPDYVKKLFDILGGWMKDAVDDGATITPADMNAFNDNYVTGQTGKIAQFIKMLPYVNALHTALANNKQDILAVYGIAVNDQVIGINYNKDYVRFLFDTLGGWMKDANPNDGDAITAADMAAFDNNYVNGQTGKIAQFIKMLPYVNALHTALANNKQDILAVYGIAVNDQVIGINYNKDYVRFLFDTLGGWLKDAVDDGATITPADMAAFTNAYVTEKINKFIAVLPYVKKLHESISANNSAKNAFKDVFGIDVGSLPLSAANTEANKKYIKQLFDILGGWYDDWQEKMTAGAPNTPNTFGDYVKQQIPIFIAVLPHVKKLSDSLNTSAGAKEAVYDIFGIEVSGLPLGDTDAKRKYFEFLFDTLGGWMDQDGNEEISSQEIQDFDNEFVKGKIDTFVLLLPHIKTLHDKLAGVRDDIAVLFGIASAEQKIGVGYNKKYIKLLFGIMGGWLDKDENGIISEGEKTYFTNTYVTKQIDDFVKLLPAARKLFEEFKKHVFTSEETAALKNLYNSGLPVLTASYYLKAGTAGSSEDKFFAKLLFGMASDYYNVKQEGLYTEDEAAYFKDWLKVLPVASKFMDQFRSHTLTTDQIGFVKNIYGKGLPQINASYFLKVGATGADEDRFFGNLLFGMAKDYMTAREEQLFTGNENEWFNDWLKILPSASELIINFRTHKFTVGQIDAISKIYNQKLPANLGQGYYIKVGFTEISAEDRFFGNLLFGMAKDYNDSVAAGEFTDTASSWFKQWNDLLPYAAKIFTRLKELYPSIQDKTALNNALQKLYKGGIPADFGTGYFVKVGLKAGKDSRMIGKLIFDLAKEYVDNKDAYEKTYKTYQKEDGTYGVIRLALTPDGSLSGEDEARLNAFIEDFLENIVEVVAMLESPEFNNLFSIPQNILDRDVSDKERKQAIQFAFTFANNIGNNRDFDNINEFLAVVKIAQKLVINEYFMITWHGDKSIIDLLNYRNSPKSNYPEEEKEFYGMVVGELFGIVRWLKNTKLNNPTATYESVLGELESVAEQYLNNEIRNAALLLQDEEFMKLLGASKDDTRWGRYAGGRLVQQNVQRRANLLQTVFYFVQKLGISNGKLWKDINELHEFAEIANQIKDPVMKYVAEGGRGWVEQLSVPATESELAEIRSYSHVMAMMDHTKVPHLRVMMGDLTLLFLNAKSIYDARHNYDSLMDPVDGRITIKAYNGADRTNLEMATDVIKIIPGTDLIESVAHTELDGQGNPVTTVEYFINTRAVYRNGKFIDRKNGTSPFAKVIKGSTELELNSFMSPLFIGFEKGKEQVYKTEKLLKFENGKPVEKVIYINKKAKYHVYIQGEEGVKGTSKTYLEGTKELLSEASWETVSDGKEYGYPGKKILVTKVKHYTIQANGQKTETEETVINDYDSKVVLQRRQGGVIRKAIMHLPGTTDIFMLYEDWTLQGVKIGEGHLRADGTMFPAFQDGNLVYDYIDTTTKVKTPSVVMVNLNGEWLSTMSEGDSVKVENEGNISGTDLSGKSVKYAKAKDGEWRQVEVAVTPSDPATGMPKYLKFTFISDTGVEVTIENLVQVYKYDGSTGEKVIEYVDKSGRTIIRIEGDTAVINFGRIYGRNIAERSIAVRSSSLEISTEGFVLKDSIKVLKEQGKILRDSKIVEVDSKGVPVVADDRDYTGKPVGTTKILTEDYALGITYTDYIDMATGDLVHRVYENGMKVEFFNNLPGVDIATQFVVISPDGIVQEEGVMDVNKTTGMPYTYDFKFEETEYKLYRFTVYDRIHKSNPPRVEYRNKLGQAILTIGANTAAISTFDGDSQFVTVSTVYPKKAFTLIEDKVKVQRAGVLKFDPEYLPMAEAATSISQDKTKVIITIDHYRYVEDNQVKILTEEIVKDRKTGRILEHNIGNVVTKITEVMEGTESQGGIPVKYTDYAKVNGELVEIGTGVYTGMEAGNFVYEYTTTEGQRYIKHRDIQGREVKTIFEVNGGKIITETWFDNNTTLPVAKKSIVTVVTPSGKTYDKEEYKFVGYSEDGDRVYRVHDLITGAVYRVFRTPLGQPLTLYYDRGYVKVVNSDFIPNTDVAKRSVKYSAFKKGQWTPVEETTVPSDWLTKDGRLIYTDLTIGGKKIDRVRKIQKRDLLTGKTWVEYVNELGATVVKVTDTEVTINDLIFGTSSPRTSIVINIGVSGMTVSTSGVAFAESFEALKGRASLVVGEGELDSKGLPVTEPYMGHDENTYQVRKVPVIDRANQKTYIDYIDVVTGNLIARIHEDGTKEKYWKYLKGTKIAQRSIVINPEGYAIQNSTIEIDSVTGIPTIYTFTAQDGNVYKLMKHIVRSGVVPGKVWVEYKNDFGQTVIYVGQDTVGISAEFEGSSQFAKQVKEYKHSALVFGNDLDDIEQKLADLGVDVESLGIDIQSLFADILAGTLSKDVKATLLEKGVKIEEVRKILRYYRELIKSPRTLTINLKPGAQPAKTKDLKSMAKPVSAYGFNPAISGELKSEMVLVHYAVTDHVANQNYDIYQTVYGDEVVRTRRVEKDGGVVAIIKKGVAERTGYAKATIIKAIPDTGTPYITKYSVMDWNTKANMPEIHKLPAIKYNPDTNVYEQEMTLNPKTNKYEPRYIYTTQEFVTEYPYGSEAGMTVYAIEYRDTNGALILRQDANSDWMVDPKGIDVYNLKFTKVSDSIMATEYIAVEKKPGQVLGTVIRRGQNGKWENGKLHIEVKDMKTGDIVDEYYNTEGQKVRQDIRHWRTTEIHNDTFILGTATPIDSSVVEDGEIIKRYHSKGMVTSIEGIALTEPLLERAVEELYIDHEGNKKWANSTEWYNTKGLKIYTKSSDNNWFSKYEYDEVGNPTRVTLYYKKIDKRHIRTVTTISGKIPAEKLLDDNLPEELMTMWKKEGYAVGNYIQAKVANKWNGAVTYEYRHEKDPMGRIIYTKHLPVGEVTMRGGFRGNSPIKSYLFDNATKTIATYEPTGNEDAEGNVEVKVSPKGDVPHFIYVSQNKPGEIIDPFGKTLYEMTVNKKWRTNYKYDEGTAHVRRAELLHQNSDGTQTLVKVSLAAEQISILDFDFYLHLPEDIKDSLSQLGVGVSFANSALEKALNDLEDKIPYSFDQIIALAKLGGREITQDDISKAIIDAKIKGPMVSGKVSLYKVLEQLGLVFSTRIEASLVTEKLTGLRYKEYRIIGSPIGNTIFKENLDGDTDNVIASTVTVKFAGRTPLESYMYDKDYKLSLISKGAIEYGADGLPKSVLVTKSNLKTKLVWQERYDMLGRMIARYDGRMEKGVFVPVTISEFIYDNPVLTEYDRASGVNKYLYDKTKADGKGRLLSEDVAIQQVDGKWISDNYEVLYQSHDVIKQVYQQKLRDIIGREIVVYDGEWDDKAKVFHRWTKTVNIFEGLAGLMEIASSSETYYVFGEKDVERFADENKVIFRSKLLGDINTNFTDQFGNVLIEVFSPVTKVTLRRMLDNKGRLIREYDGKIAESETELNGRKYRRGDFIYRKATDYTYKDDVAGISGIASGGTTYVVRWKNNIEEKGEELSKAETIMINSDGAIVTQITDLKRYGYDKDGRLVHLVWQQKMGKFGAIDEKYDGYLQKDNSFVKMLSTRNVFKTPIYRILHIASSSSSYMKEKNVEKVVSKSEVDDKFSSSTVFPFISNNGEVKVDYEDILMNHKFYEIKDNKGNVLEKGEERLYTTNGKPAKYKRITTFKYDDSNYGLYDVAYETETSNVYLNEDGKEVREPFTISKTISFENGQTRFSYENLITHIYWDEVKDYRGRIFVVYDIYSNENGQKAQKDGKDDFYRCTISFYDDTLLIGFLGLPIETEGYLTNSDGTISIGGEEKMPDEIIKMSSEARKEDRISRSYLIDQTLIGQLKTGVIAPDAWEGKLKMPVSPTFNQIFSDKGDFGYVVENYYDAEEVEPGTTDKLVKIGKVVVQHVEIKDHYGRKITEIRRNKTALTYFSEEAGLPTPDQEQYNLMIRELSYEGEKGVYDVADHTDTDINGNKIWSSNSVDIDKSTGQVTYEVRNHITLGKWKETKTGRGLLIFREDGQVLMQVKDNVSIDPSIRGKKIKEIKSYDSAKEILQVVFEDGTTGEVLLKQLVFLPERKSIIKYDRLYKRKDGTVSNIVDYGFPSVSVVYQFDGSNIIGDAITTQKFSYVDKNGYFVYGTEDKEATSLSHVVFSEDGVISYQAYQGAGWGPKEVRLYYTPDEIADFAIVVKDEQNRQITPKPQTICIPVLVGPGEIWIFEIPFEEDIEEFLMKNVFSEEGFMPNAKDLPHRMLKFGKVVDIAETKWRDKTPTSGGKWVNPALVDRIVRNSLIGKLGLNKGASTGTPPQIDSAISLPSVASGEGTTQGVPQKPAIEVLKEKREMLKKFGYKEWYEKIIEDKLGIRIPESIPKWTLPLILFTGVVFVYWVIRYLLYPFVKYTRKKRESDRSLKGQKAGAVNPVIRNLIKRGKVVEIEYNPSSGIFDAYSVNWVEGYTPGVTAVNQYRGDDIDINTILTYDQQLRLKAWMADRSNWVNNRPPKLRVIKGEVAIGWSNSREHAAIAHSGFRDQCIYIGEGLLASIFDIDNDLLVTKLLNEDELRHLRDEKYQDAKDPKYPDRLREVHERCKDIMPSFVEEKGELISAQYRVALEKLVNEVKLSRDTLNTIVDAVRGDISIPFSAKGYEVYVRATREAYRPVIEGYFEKLGLKRLSPDDDAKAKELMNSILQARGRQAKAKSDKNVDAENKAKDEEKAFIKELKALTSEWEKMGVTYVDPFYLRFNPKTSKEDTRPIIDLVIDKMVAKLIARNISHNKPWKVEELVSSPDGLYIKVERARSEFERGASGNLVNEFTGWVEIPLYQDFLATFLPFLSGSLGQNSSYLHHLFWLARKTKDPKKLVNEVAERTAFWSAILHDQLQLKLKSEVQDADVIEAKRVLFEESYLYNMFPHLNYGDPLESLNVTVGLVKDNLNALRDGLWDDVLKVVEANAKDPKSIVTEATYNLLNSAGNANRNITYTGLNTLLYALQKMEPLYGVIGTIRTPVVPTNTGMVEGHVKRLKELRDKNECGDIPISIVEETIRLGDEKVAEMKAFRYDSDRLKEINNRLNEILNTYFYRSRFMQRILDQKFIPFVLEQWKKEERPIFVYPSKFLNIWNVLYHITPSSITFLRRFFKEMSRGKPGLMDYWLDVRAHKDFKGFKDTSLTKYRDRLTPEQRTELKSEGLYKYLRGSVSTGMGREEWEKLPIIEKAKVIKGVRFFETYTRMSYKIQDILAAGLAVATAYILIYSWMLPPIIGIMGVVGVLMLLHTAIRFIVPQHQFSIPSVINLLLLVLMYKFAWPAVAFEAGVPVIPTLASIFKSAPYFILLHAPWLFFSTLMFRATTYIGAWWVNRGSFAQKRQYFLRYKTDVGAGLSKLGNTFIEGGMPVIRDTSAMYYVKNIILAIITGGIWLIWLVTRKLRANREFNLNNYTRQGETRRKTVTRAYLLYMYSINKLYEDSIINKDQWDKLRKFDANVSFTTEEAWQRVKSVLNKFYSVGFDETTTLDWVEREKTTIQIHGVGEPFFTSWNDLVKVLEIDDGKKSDGVIRTPSARSELWYLINNIYHDEWRFFVEKLIRDGWITASDATMFLNVDNFGLGKTNDFISRINPTGNNLDVFFGGSHAEYEKFIKDRITNWANMHMSCGYKTSEGVKHILEVAKIWAEVEFENENSDYINMKIEFATRPERQKQLYEKMLNKLGDKFGSTSERYLKILGVYGRTGCIPLYVLDQDYADYVLNELSREEKEFIKKSEYYTKAVKDKYQITYSMYPQQNYIKTPENAYFMDIGVWNTGDSPLRHNRAVEGYHASTEGFIMGPREQVALWKAPALGIMARYRNPFSIRFDATQELRPEEAVLFPRLGESLSMPNVAFHLYGMYALNKKLSAVNENLDLSESTWTQMQQNWMVTVGSVGVYGKYAVDEEYLQNYGVIPLSRPAEDTPEAMSQSIQGLEGRHTLSVKVAGSKGLTLTTALTPETKYAGDYPDIIHEIIPSNFYLSKKVPLNWKYTHLSVSGGFYGPKPIVMLANIVFAILGVVFFLDPAHSIPLAVLFVFFSYAMRMSINFNSIFLMNLQYGFPFGLMKFIWGWLLKPGFLWLFTLLIPHYSGYQEEKTLQGKYAFIPSQRTSPTSGESWQYVYNQNKQAIKKGAPLLLMILIMAPYHPLMFFVVSSVYIFMVTGWVVGPFHFRARLKERGLWQQVWSPLLGVITTGAIGSLLSFTTGLPSWLSWLTPVFNFIGITFGASLGNYALIGIAGAYLIYWFMSGLRGRIEQGKLMRENIITALLFSLVLHMAFTGNIFPFVVVFATFLLNGNVRRWAKDVIIGGLLYAMPKGVKDAFKDWFRWERGKGFTKTGWFVAALAPTFIVWWIGYPMFAYYIIFAPYLLTYTALWILKQWQTYQLRRKLDPIFGERAKEYREYTLKQIGGLAGYTPEELENRRVLALIRDTMYTYINEKTVVMEGRGSKQAQYGFTDDKTLADSDIGFNYIYKHLPKVDIIPVETGYPYKLFPIVSPQPTIPPKPYPAEVIGAVVPTNTVRGNVTVSVKNGVVNIENIDSLNISAEEKRALIEVLTFAAGELMTEGQSKNINIMISSSTKKLILHHEKAGEQTLEIHWAFLKSAPAGAKESAEERMLFLKGAMWHDMYHVLYPQLSEEEVERKTVEYFNQCPEILNATIKVLSNDNPNWIYGENWVNRLVAVSEIERLLSQPVISKQDLPNLPIEGDILTKPQELDTLLRNTLQELKKAVISSPANAGSVLYILGKQSLVDIIRSTGELMPTNGGVLKIIDASVLENVDIGSFMRTINTDNTKPVVVDLTGTHNDIIQSVRGLGMAVVENSELIGNVPEDIAMTNALRQYKGFSISSREVVTTIENAATWSYAETIRYIVCSKNLTNAALLSLYNALPNDVKEALKRADITAETITRATIQNTGLTTASYILQEYRDRQAVIEVAA
jgi:hypothetical protein